MYRFNRLPRGSFQQNRRGNSSSRGGRSRRRPFVNRRVKRRNARKLSALQTIAKSTIEFVSALPFVPTPIKSIADFVGKQLGVAEVTNADARGAINGTPNFIIYYFEVSILAFVTASKNLVINSPANQTLSNFRTAQPQTWTLTVSPVGRLSSVEGFLHVAMFPYVSPSSPKEMRDFDKTGFGITDFIARAPIKKRASATSTITLSYQVPTSNAFLNRGFDLSKPSSSNGVFAVYIGFEQQNRDSYDDFKPSDFDVDVRFTGQAKLGDPNTTCPIAFAGITCTDLLKGLPSRMFIKNKDGVKTVLDGTKFVYDDKDNSMFGPEKLLKNSIMTHHQRLSDDDDYDMGTDEFSELKV